MQQEELHREQISTVQKATIVLPRLPDRFHVPQEPSIQIGTLSPLLTVLLAPKVTTVQTLLKILLRHYNAWLVSTVLLE